MKFDVVVNPAGAGGKTGAFWRSVEPQFHDVDYEVHFSTREHGIREITYELTAAGRPVNLVIVGGDGSMNEAINGICNFESVKLGLLPSGSANDLAKDIGISASLQEQTACIKQGKTVRQIDVGELILHNYADPDSSKTTDPQPCEKHLRFNVSAGLGWDAEICYLAEHSSWKKALNKIRLGKLIYISKAIQSVFGMHTFVCEAEADSEKTVYDKCVFCAVMNHRFEGGGFMFGPHALNQDGILDLCAINDITIPAFFMMFPRAYKGKQFETKYAYETRAAGFRFRTDRPVFVHTDGEVQGLSSDVTIRLYEKKLNLLF